MRFMEAAGVDFDALRQVDFYSAHEALLLEYEDAMIRVDSRSGRLYDTSAHLLWVGERTRGPQDAHVTLLTGVHNPVGVKIGPDTDPDDVVALIDRLNTALDYELAVLKVYADPLLRCVNPTQKEYGEACRLLSFLYNFSPIPPTAVPARSIQMILGAEGSTSQLHCESASRLHTTSPVAADTPASLLPFASSLGSSQLLLLTTQTTQTSPITKGPSSRGPPRKVFPSCCGVFDQS